MKHNATVPRNWAAALLFCVAWTPQCPAQADSWEHVSIIQPGRNIYVELHTKKALKGKMDAWRADGLSLQQGGDRVVSIAKSDVAQVALLIGRSRLRKAAWAGLITGTIGGGLSAVAYKASECCEVSTAVVAVSSGAFWGAAAAAIAALFPQHHEVIYTAPVQ